MSIQIDIEKSIARRRLYLKEPLWLSLMEYTVLYSFGSIPVVVCALIILNNDDSLQAGEWILISPIILLSIFLLYRIFMINRLKSIPGKGAKVNKALVNQLIGQIGLKKTVDIKDYIIAETPIQLTSWGHVVVFIFYEGNVLANVHTKGMAGTKPPFHIMSESNLWRDIRLKFK